jgi:hypothetical protein
MQETSFSITHALKIEGAETWLDGKTSAAAPIESKTHTDTAFDLVDAETICFSL